MSNAPVKLDNFTVSKTFTAKASDSLYKISTLVTSSLVCISAEVVSGIGTFTNILFIEFSNQVNIVDL